MSINIKGFAETREVFIDGKELTPKESCKIWNHSPDGFCWGYNGSGPAQLALAILLYALPGDRHLAKLYHQRFKEKFIAPLPIDGDFEIDVNVSEWVNNEKKQKR